MNKFITNFKTVLESFQDKQLLNEMPVGISSKDTWVNNILCQIIYSSINIPKNLKDKFHLEHPNITPKKDRNDSRYYLDTIAEKMSERIKKVVWGMEPAGAKTKEFITQNLDTILEQAQYGADSPVHNMVKSNILVVLSTLKDSAVIENSLNRDTFVDIPTRLILEEVFEDLFSQNTRFTAFTDVTKKVKQDVSPEFVSDPDDPSDMEGYMSYIITTLRSFLPVLSGMLKVPYTLKENELEYTARIIGLGNSELQASFPLSLKGKLRGTSGVITKSQMQQNDDSSWYHRAKDAAYVASAQERYANSNTKEYNAQQAAMTKFRETTWELTDNVSNLDDRELEVYDELRGLLNLNLTKQYTGADLIRTNREPRVLPNPVSLAVFVNRLVSKGAINTISEPTAAPFNKQGVTPAEEPKKPVIKGFAADFF